MYQVDQPYEKLKAEIIEIDELPVAETTVAEMVIDDEDVHELCKNCLLGDVCLQKWCLLKCKDFYVELADRELRQCHAGKLERCAAKWAARRKYENEAKKHADLNEYLDMLKEIHKHVIDKYTGYVFDTAIRPKIKSILVDKIELLQDHAARLVEMAEQVAAVVKEIQG